VVVKKSTPPTGGKFKKGTSGNPSGRPLGSRNKATLLAEQLLDAEAEQLIAQVLTPAKKGNMQALRLCIERLIPVRKERLIQLDLPPARNLEEIAARCQSILAAVGEGRITPGEAQTVSETLSNHAHLLEAVNTQQSIKRNEAYNQAYKEKQEKRQRDEQSRLERLFNGTIQPAKA